MRREDAIPYDQPSMDPGFRMIEVRLVRRYDAIISSYRSQEFTSIMRNHNPTISTPRRPDSKSVSGSWNVGAIKTRMR